jgi:hypothetical protein
MPENGFLSSELMYKRVMEIFRIRTCHHENLWSNEELKKVVGDLANRYANACVSAGLFIKGLYLFDMWAARLRFVAQGDFYCRKYLLYDDYGWEFISLMNYCNRYLEPMSKYIESNSSNSDVFINIVCELHNAFYNSYILPRLRDLHFNVLYDTFNFPEGVIDADSDLRRAWNALFELTPALFPDVMGITTPEFRSNIGFMAYYAYLLGATIEETKLFYRGWAALYQPCMASTSDRPLLYVNIPVTRYDAAKRPRLSFVRKNRILIGNLDDITADEVSFATLWYNALLHEEMFLYHPYTVKRRYLRHVPRDTHQPFGISELFKPRAITAENRGSLADLPRGRQYMVIYWQSRITDCLVVET